MLVILEAEYNRYEVDEQVQVVHRPRYALGSGRRQQQDDDAQRKAVGHQTYEHAHGGHAHRAHQPALSLAHSRSRFAVGLPVNHERIQKQTEEYELREHECAGGQVVRGVVDDVFEVVHAAGARDPEIHRLQEGDCACRGAAGQQQQDEGIAEKPDRAVVEVFQRGLRVDHAHSVPEEHVRGQDGHAVEDYGRVDDRFAPGVAAFGRVSARRPHADVDNCLRRQTRDDCHRRHSDGHVDHGRSLRIAALLVPPSRLVLEQREEEPTRSSDHQERVDFSENPAPSVMRWDIVDDEGGGREAG